jgi:hypothetical protein
VSFFDYSYRFLINFELFCSDLTVFDIPEFTARYPFLTFPFIDSDRTKIYADENGERFFSDRYRSFSPLFMYIRGFTALLLVQGSAKQVQETEQRNK